MRPVTPTVKVSVTKTVEVKTVVRTASGRVVVAVTPTVVVGAGAVSENVTVVVSGTVTLVTWVTRAVVVAVDTDGRALVVAPQ